MQVKSPVECGLRHHDRPHSSLHEAWPEASSFVPFRKLHCMCPLLTGLTHFSERGWGFSYHFREPHIQKLLNCFEYVQRKTVVTTGVVIIHSFNDVRMYQTLCLVYGHVENDSGIIICMGVKKSLASLMII